jgi:hypothetical protein
MPESSLQIQVERIAEGHLSKANSAISRASDLGAGAMHCVSPRHCSPPPIANPADIAAAMAAITSAVAQGAITPGKAHGRGRARGHSGYVRSARHGRDEAQSRSCRGGGGARGCAPAPDAAIP